jgi:hypothetical protein
VVWCGLHSFPLLVVSVFVLGGRKLLRLSDVSFTVVGPMGAESIVAIEAINEGAKLDVTALNQAMMAQQFEMGLTHASETGAASFQEVEESRRKTVTAMRDNLQSSGIPEVAVHSAAPFHDFGKDIVSYMDGFSSRAKEYVSDANSFSQLQAANPVAPVEKNAPSGSDASKPASAAPDVFDPGAALRLMMESYQFSLETHLLTNAASQATGAFNGLMREQ